MRKNSLLLILPVFLILGVFGCGTVFAKTGAANYSSYVSFSSESVSQGDTLLIKIKKEAEISWASASFLSKGINFLKLDNGDLIGFAGVSAKKNPGTYSLTVNFPDGQKYTKKIKVLKRNFPVTKLMVTKELKEKGYTSKSVLQESGDNSPVFYKVLSYYSSAAFFSKPFIFPLAKITDVGSYGNIRKNESGSVQHVGVDLEAEANTPVYAANDGVVCFAGELTNYGKTVVINHGLGIFSLYLHLSEFKVSIPQLVKRGDIVGLSGSTGYSLAPHLHFSLHVRGDSIDPLLFVETSIVEMPN